MVMTVELQMVEVNPWTVRQWRAWVVRERESSIVEREWDGGNYGKKVRLACDGVLRGFQYWHCCSYTNGQDSKTANLDKQTRAKRKPSGHAGESD